MMILRSCSYLTVFDFQLEEKLKEKIDVGLSEKIDLVNEQDVFHS